jgi:hypothetical protein
MNKQNQQILQLISSQAFFLELGLGKLSSDKKLELIERITKLVDNLVTQSIIDQLPGVDPTGLLDLNDDNLKQKLESENIDIEEEYKNAFEIVQEQLLDHKSGLDELFNK